MIFNSQGDAKLRTYINGGTITPGADPITLPKGGQLLGDLTIEAVQTEQAIITPTAQQQIITPSAGKYFNQVTVEAAESASGEYAWRKYSNQLTDYTITFTQITTGNPIKIQVGSNGIDLSSVDSSFFIGLSGKYAGSYPYQFVSASKLSLNGTQYSFTYDAAKAQITLSAQISSKVTFTSATKSLRTKLGFTVSDNSAAYPESGEQDGYYYEKIA